MPAVGTTHSGHALVEDAAIEVAVDGRLDTATQVAVAVAGALLVQPEGVPKVIGESPPKDRPLGTAWAIDVCT